MDDNHFSQSQAAVVFNIVESIVIADLLDLRGSVVDATDNELSSSRKDFDVSNI